MCHYECVYVHVQAGQPPLTFASVSAALEDVRPYLLADGGDVTVLDVNVGTGVVMVELQGACSSCASSRWVGALIEQWKGAERKGAACMSLLYV